MRDRVKRRNQKDKNPQQSDDQPQGPAPLQPTFLDRDKSWAERNEGQVDGAAEGTPQPVYEAQPKKTHSMPKVPAPAHPPDEGTVRVAGAVVDVGVIAQTSSRRLHNRPARLDCRSYPVRLPVKRLRSMSPRPRRRLPSGYG